MSTILQLQKISKSFPGVRALSGIDLDIPRGEIHALLGENGAGKSTLMKILSGIYQPDEGRIFIDGTERHFANYHEAVAAGVGIVFQEFSLIPYLNAPENIFLGRELRTKLGLLDRAKMRAEAARQFGRLGVRIDLGAPVHTLSVAQQQFIEIAKALALDAQILILDEPTATLTPAEADHLFSIMRELKRQGVAMIFISHHLEEIFEICDRITVLRDGQWVGVTPVCRHGRRSPGRDDGRPAARSQFPAQAGGLPVGQDRARCRGAPGRAQRPGQLVQAARGRDPRLRGSRRFGTDRDGARGFGRRARAQEDGAGEWPARPSSPIPPRRCRSGWASCRRAARRKAS